MVRPGSPVPLTATFSGPVSGFTIEDILVVNGSANNFAGSDGDAIYTFEVTPNAIGEVTVDISADAAQDDEGEGNTAAPYFRWASHTTMTGTMRSAELRPSRP